MFVLNISQGRTHAEHKIFTQIIYLIKYKSDCLGRNVFEQFFFETLNMRQIENSARIRLHFDFVGLLFILKNIISNCIIGVGWWCGHMWRCDVIVVCVFVFYSTSVCV